MTPEQFGEIHTKMAQAIAEGNYALAQTYLNQHWLYTTMLFTQEIDPNLKELTFSKTSVDTGNGKYLLLFIHVDGEKIKL